jgi:histidyl-tRNA synthetase
MSAPGSPKRELHRSAQREGAPTASVANAQARPAALQAVRGMNDVLPDEAALWEMFEDTTRGVFRRYGYRNLRVPIVEPTPLFVRAIGEVTDVVEKEMYTFDDRLNGESLTLRPEATAGIVRAAIEHNLTYERPQRVWLAGPMFRHERPQKGRYRQFHQFDVEALGFPGPDVDAEQMVMLARLWRELGLADGIRLEINSIGDADERKAHRDALIAHFSKHADALDADARRRLQTNPLRILDSKHPAMQPIVADAPKLLDRLGDASRAHFEGLQALLAEHGIAYAINPRLVRGLDYYNRTVFEFVTDRLGTQGTVAGGGRYDGLFEQLGGKPTPACGFGMGIERMILLLQDARRNAAPAPLAYVVHAGDAAAKLARSAAEALRDAGHAVVVNAGGGSFKSQMKRADASGARYALVVGDDEAAAGTVAVKPLRESGEQIAVPAAALVRHFEALPGSASADPSKSG